MERFACERCIPPQKWNSQKVATAVGGEACLAGGGVVAGDEVERWWVGGCDGWVVWCSAMW